ncbi:MAG: DinB family protein [Rhodothermales bacterium]
MSHIAYIQRLFKYNDWANRAVLSSLQNSDRLPASSLQRMAHILAAEHVWFQRLRNEPILVPVWPAWELDEIGVEIDQMKEGWESYLSTLTELDLSTQIKYANTSGKLFDSRRDDIMQHVIAHGAYHRGQIASDLRAGGGTPAVTDLVFAFRDKLI